MPITSPEYLGPGERSAPNESVMDHHDGDHSVAYVPGADGLPKEAVQLQMPYVPPLTEDHLVCLPDLRKFVVRDAMGFVAAEFEPEEVERVPAGVHRVPLALGLQRLGAKALMLGLARKVQVAGYLEVEPRRPVCQHFGRQLVDMMSNPENQEMERLCTARRDAMGNFLSVQNSAMYACELRQPMDDPSRQRLIDHDAIKIEQGRRRVDEHDHAFDPNDELRRLQEEARRLAEEDGGVFRRKS